MPLPDYQTRVEEVEEILKHPNGDGQFKEVWADILLHPEDIKSLDLLTNGMNKIDKEELEKIAESIELMFSS